MSLAECVESNPDFVKILSRRTFCAGGKKKGPCNGDSGETKNYSLFYLKLYPRIFTGSGFFVKSGGFWALKGIVSTGFSKYGQCDVDNYAGYTNVYEFNEWIKNTVQTSLGVVKSSVNNEVSTRKPVDSSNTVITKLKLDDPSSSKCGQMSIGSEFVHDEQSGIRKGQWPFAALINNNEQNFVCNGNLISSRHVLTGEIQKLFCRLSQ